MYLPLRHDKVANVIYQNIVPKEEEKCRQPIREFYCNEQIEIWWDTEIKTLIPVQHNKPDIVMWKNEDELCFIIDISVGLDLNATNEFNQKRDNYLPLAAELKHLYDKFNFEVIPVTYTYNTYLKSMLKRIGIENINNVTLKCQKKCFTWYIENRKKFHDNVNDSNLHSAMISDNLAFRTNLAVIAAIFLWLVGVYASLPHEGV